MHQPDENKYVKMQMLRSSLTTQYKNNVSEKELRVILF